MSNDPHLSAGSHDPERPARRALRYAVLGALLVLGSAGGISAWRWFQTQLSEQRLLREEQALRNLGVALLLYSGTNDGALPGDLAQLVDLGLAEPADLKSPRRASSTRVCHYFYIEGLTAADPPEWIVAFFYANDGSDCTALQLGGEVVRLARTALEERLSDATDTVFNTQGRQELVVHAPQ